LTYPIKVKNIRERRRCRGREGGERRGKEEEREDDEKKA